MMANEMYCDNFIMSEDGEKFEMTQTSKGDPGFSPIANVTKEGDVTTITITDEKGTTTAEIDISGKVDKVEGKGLSTNDYTNEEKQKVADAALQTDLTALARQVSGKQNAPATAGTAGQVLSLNDQLQPVWMDQTSGEDVAPVIINTASGAIASFDDGADGQPIRKLVAKIEPVQDLHGYANPWPAGGGKNLLSIDPSIVTITKNGVTFTVNRNSDGDVTSVVANGTATNRTYFYLGYYNINGGTILNGAPSGGSQDAYALAFDGTSIFDYGNGSAIANDLTNNLLMIVIANGFVCNNLTFHPMIRLATETDATFAPYSNECPISGWTGAEIEQRGGNLLKPTEYGGVFYAAQVGRSLAEVMAITATPIDDGYSVIIPTSWHGKIFATDVLPAGNYNAHVKTDVSNTRFAMYITDANYVVTSEVGRISQSGTVDKQITLTEKGRIVFFIGADSALTINVHDLQVESGSSFTSYHPYTGNQISIDWSDEAGTIYGGEHDVISGKLKVDIFNGVIDNFIGDGYAYNQTDDFYYGYLPGAFPTPAKSGGIFDFLRSSNPRINNHDCAYIFPSRIIRINISQLERTAEAYRAYLAQHPLQVVYSIAPIEYQFTPQEIDTLLGTNNIWSSTGDTEVEYPCDTRLYIDRKIAEALGG